MLTVSCPSCGAPVQFRSHAAVMAVCEYCRASVLKDLGSVENIGKLSEVLEDYSPIQSGTSCVAGDRGFTVIGRIQLRYSDGIWNEWYVLFDDGSSSWLGDASGQYMLTTPRKVDGELPAFDEIEAGKRYTVGGERLTAADIRTATCIGGQGELPLFVGDGWETRVADFREAGRFLTLDYSDGERPQVYDGVSLTLAQMKCQLLRDDEQIKASAGRYRGKLDALDCPSCGGMIKYLPGVTTTLVCPSCAAQLDASGPEAQVLQAGERVTQASLALELGATAKINGSDHTVIGAMVRLDDEGSQWTEYLVYSARAGFFWLVDSEGEWYRANVLDVWPEWNWTGSATARLDKVDYEKTFEYPATVQFAAGAFNWRVKAGDVVRLHEFESQSGKASLSAELSAHELTWSRSTPVAHDQLKAWFGPALRAGGANRRPPGRPAATERSNSCGGSSASMPSL